MPKPLPQSLAESLPISAETNPAESSDVMRALGGVGLPGDQAVGRLDGSGGSKETGVSSWEVADKAHVAVDSLFSEMLPQLAVPDLREFVQAGVDFTKLQKGHEAYEQAGMKPELVFAPVNLPLDNWEEIYSRLCQWQGVRHSNSKFRLKNGAHEGLDVWIDVESNWEKLNEFAANTSASTIVRGPNSLVWRAAVIPTASKAKGGLATNTSFDLSQHSDEFLAMVRTSGIQPPLSAVNAHMPIGMYLTLQAKRLFNKEKLLDKDTSTWGMGTFTDNEDGRLKAPVLSWEAGTGSVLVDCTDVDCIFPLTGVRLPVWG